MDKRELARDPTTSPEVLEELSNDKHALVRILIAQNPNCPIKVLEKFAFDIVRLVRVSVAQNPNCPDHIKTYFDARNYMKRVTLTELSHPPATAHEISGILLE